MKRAGLQKIEDVERPVVGRFYLVPCVEWNRIGWLPVIGAWHEDKEDVGFEMHHFHRDVRFFTKRQFTYLEPERELVRVWTGSGPETVVYKRKKMKREMPEFPTRGSGKTIGFLRALERRYQRQRLTCGICPHRGMSLKGMPEKDGLVVCHGHGLRWNVKTGEMVPRMTMATAGPTPEERQ